MTLEIRQNHPDVNRLGYVTNGLHHARAVSDLVQNIDSGFDVQIDELFPPNLFLFRTLFTPAQMAMVSTSVKINTDDHIWGQSYAAGGNTIWPLTHFVNNFYGAAFPAGINPPNTDFMERARYNASIYDYVAMVYQNLRYTPRYLKQNEVITLLNAAADYVAMPEGIDGLNVDPGSQAHDVLTAIRASNKAKSDYDSEASLFLALNIAADFPAFVHSPDYADGTVDEYIDSELNYWIGKIPLLTNKFLRVISGKNLQVLAAAAEAKTLSSHFSYLAKLYSYIGVLPGIIRVAIISNILRHPVFKFMLNIPSFVDAYNEAQQNIDKFVKMDFLDLAGKGWERTGIFKGTSCSYELVPRWLLQIISRLDAPVESLAEIFPQDIIQHGGMAVDLDFNYQYNYGDPTSSIRRFNIHSQRMIKQELVQLYNNLAQYVQAIVNTEYFEWFNNTQEYEISIADTISSNKQDFTQDTEVGVAVDEVEIFESEIGGILNKSQSQISILDAAYGNVIRADGWDENGQLVSVDNALIRTNTTCRTLVTDAFNDLPKTLINGVYHQLTLVSSERRCLDQAIWSHGWNLVPDCLGWTPVVHKNDADGLANAIGFKNIIKMRRHFFQRFGHSHNLNNVQLAHLQIVALSLVNIGQVFYTTNGAAPDLNNELYDGESINENALVNPLWFGNQDNTTRGALGCILTRNQAGNCLNGSPFIALSEGIYFVPYSRIYRFPGFPSANYEVMNILHGYEDVLLQSHDAREYIQSMIRMIVWRPIEDPTGENFWPVKGIVVRDDDNLHPDKNNIVIVTKRPRSFPIFFDFKYIEDDDVAVPFHLYLNDSMIAYKEDEKSGYTPIHIPRPPKTFLAGVQGMEGEIAKLTE